MLINLIKTLFIHESSCSPKMRRSRLKAIKIEVSFIIQFPYLFLRATTTTTTTVRVKEREKNYNIIKEEAATAGDWTQMCEREHLKGKRAMRNFWSAFKVDHFWLLLLQGSHCLIESRIAREEWQQQQRSPVKLDTEAISFTRWVHTQLSRPLEPLRNAVVSHCFRERPLPDR
jgi:hypothetical protein